MNKPDCSRESSLPRVFSSILCPRLIPVLVACVQVVFEFGSSRGFPYCLQSGHVTFTSPLDLFIPLIVS